MKEIVEEFYVQKFEEDKEQAPVQMPSDSKNVLNLSDLKDRKNKNIDDVINEKMLSKPSEMDEISS